MEGVGPVQEHTYTVPYPTTTATVKVWDSEGSSTEKSVVINVHGWHTYAVDLDKQSGVNAHLAVVGGVPAICYGSSLSEQIKYVTAIDVERYLWNEPVIIANVNPDTAYADFAIISGKPAVSYFDDSDQSIKYVSAKYPDGSEWNSPVVAAAPGDISKRTSICEIEGFPALAFRGGVTGKLYFARANDSDGTTWPTPTAIVSSADVFYPSMAVVDGRPAIAFLDNLAHKTKYIISDDALGNTWPFPQIVGSPGEASSMVRLKEIAGKPCIAFLQESTKNLLFIVGLIPEGTEWNEAVTIYGNAEVKNTFHFSVIGQEVWMLFQTSVVNPSGPRVCKASIWNLDSWSTPYLLSEGGNIGSLVGFEGEPIVAFQGVDRELRLFFGYFG
ncbi:MAG: hypothetical protein HRF49_06105 [bacterium]